MAVRICHAFAELEDPHQAHKIKHNLQDIIVLAISGLTLYFTPEDVPELTAYLAK